MDLEQRLRESLAAPDPGAAFTDAVMARAAKSLSRRDGSSVSGTAKGRNRWLWRFVLVGIAAAAGIAAAMLAEHLARVPARSVVAMVSKPTPIVAATDTSTVAGASAGVTPAGSRRDTTQAAKAPSSLPAASSPQQADVASRYSVLVMPLRQEVHDPAARNRVEMFHAAILQELRGVPGLTLMVQDDVPTPLEQQADYVMVLTGIEIEGRPDVVRVKSEIHSRGQQPTFMTSESAFSVDGTRGATVAQEAADVVGTLRKRVFPP